MTSCMILSCGIVKIVKPMRLAGTCSRYSNSAIPQLTSAAVYQGEDARFLRCPYQANVMKPLLATRSRMVCSGMGRDWRMFMAYQGASHLDPRQHRILDKKWLQRFTYMR